MGIFGGGALRKRNLRLAGGEPFHLLHLEPTGCGAFAVRTASGPHCNEGRTSTFAALSNGRGRVL